MSETIRFEIPQTINLRGVNRMLDYDQRMIRGNRGAHVWRVRVMDGQQDADLTGMTASLYIARQDGKTVHVTDGITIEGNVVRAVLGRDAYAVAGRTLFELDVMQGEETITCATMQANVTQVRTDNLVEPDVGEIYDIEQLMAQIDAMRKATADGERAAGEADDAAAEANTAAGSATSAASRANAAAAAIEGMTATAEALDTGEAARASVTVVDGHYVLALGLPRGLTGATPTITPAVQTGEPGTNARLTVSGTEENQVWTFVIPRGNTGKIGDLTINGIAPGDDGSVTLTAQDVGARPADWTPSAEDVGARPDTWTPGIDDIDGLRIAINNAGGVKTVAGVEPDSVGNVPLTAGDVGAMQWSLLWENASPTSEFAEQVLPGTYTWTGYDMLMIVYVYDVTTTARAEYKLAQIVECAIGMKSYLQMYSVSGGLLFARAVYLNDDGTIELSGAQKRTFASITTVTADNKGCVPLRIYGAKGVQQS